MSRLYYYFISCWKNDTVIVEQLQNAVTKGYITSEEKVSIEATPRQITV